MRHRRAVAVLGAVLGFVSGCAEAPTFDDHGFDTARCPFLGAPELCGGCDPRCFRVHSSPTGRDLTDATSDRVRFDLDRNGLVLGGKTLEARFSFIANDEEGTISKLDQVTGNEVGRYRVGSHPSAIAVDWVGNGFVVMTGEPVETVSMIAGNRSICVDRNRNHRIDSTSGSTVLPRGADECLIWTSSEAAGACPRAVAIDQRNRVWVGGWCTRQFHVLAAEDGSLIRTVPVSASVYDAAIGRDGTLWYSGRSHSVIQSIDTETFEVGPTIRPSCGGDLEGITVDGENRVWIVCAHQPCRAARYDPRDGTWLNICDIPFPRAARDVAFDHNGDVWISAHASWTGNTGPSFGYHYEASTGALLDEAPIPGCDGANGISASFDLRIWFVCRGSWSVDVLDPEDGATTHAMVGAFPSTYGDFIGMQTAAIQSRRGSYKRVYDSALACDTDETVRWEQLYFQAVTPYETEVSFTARTSDSHRNLRRADDVLLGTQPGDTSPVDVSGILAAEGVPNGQRYFEVEVVLQSLDGSTSPVFRNMDMVFYCECACDEDRSCSAGCDCDDDC
jgi:streptogramin lyase